MLHVNTQLFYIVLRVILQHQQQLYSYHCHTSYIRGTLQHWQKQHSSHCHTCQFTVQGQPTTVTTFKSLSHLPHKLAQKPATAKIFLLYPQTAFNRSWLQHLTQSVQKLERNPALQQSTSELTMLKNIFLNNGAPVLPGRACTDRVYLYCRAGPALTESPTCDKG